MEEPQKQCPDCSHCTVINGKCDLCGYKAKAEAKKGK